MTTTSPGGYTLSAHDPDANGAIYNAGAGANVIWNLAGTVGAPAVFAGDGIAISVFGGNQTPPAWCNANQALCPDTGNPAELTDTDLRWARLTGTAQQISLNNAPITNDTTRIATRMRVPAVQAPGTYTGAITITATAVP